MTEEVGREDNDYMTFSLKRQGEISPRTGHGS